SAGKIEMYLPPGGLGVRIDSGVYPGYTISPFYDSMIAKVISYGATREEAIARMRRALEEFIIDGVHNTIPFHLNLHRQETFYESMIVKVISYGATREEVIARMRRALEEFIIDGVNTTIPFHLNLLEHETFISGDFNTKFLEEHDVMKNKSTEV